MLPKTEETRLAKMRRKGVLMDVTHWLSTYGYWAVLLFVSIESTGIPFPGETMLLVAAIAAGTTHQLSIPLVIGAAVCGAILGDQLGYWIGATGGARLLLRNTRFVRRMERKLKLGLALFQQHGGKVVFFGRFVTVLRVWAALLAGVFRLRWHRFFLFNACGAVIWATIYGLGGYVLGDNIHRLTGPLGWGLLSLTGCLMLVLVLFWRKQEQVWEERATRLFPGPLEQYLGRAVSKRTVLEPSAMPLGRRDWEDAATQPLCIPDRGRHELAASQLLLVSHPPLDTREQPLPSGGAARSLRPVHLERVSSWKESSTEQKRIV